MGLATSFLSGSKEEWSLVRRHPSEKIFGAQVAGNKPHNLVPTAEVIRNELGSSGVDFVDLNCGCPIDLVFKQGSGSACKFSSISRHLLSETVLCSVGLDRKIRKDPDWNEQGLGRHPIDGQATYGCQGWKEHRAQTYASAGN